jgi:hypothetical protein
MFNIVKFCFNDAQLCLIVGSPETEFYQNEMAEKVFSPKFWRNFAETIWQNIYFAK